MRQLNPSSNLVLSVLAGLGLLGSLTLPWFAAPATDPSNFDGPVERAGWQIGHVFASSARGLVDGDDAIGGGRLALLGLVIAVAVLGVAVSANVARQAAEDALRLVAFAIPVVLVVVVVAHAGTTSEVSIHWGMLVGFAAAVLMATSAYHGASWRKKYAAPTRPRYGTTAR